MMRHTVRVFLFLCVLVTQGRQPARAESNKFPEHWFSRSYFTMLEEAPYGIDRVFRNFFRISGFDLDQEVDEILEQAQQDPTLAPPGVVDRLPLDRLSLLACERQGLQPVELLARETPDNNTSQSRATPRSAVAAMRRIAEAKQEAAAARRLGKVRVAESERRSIVAVLLAIDLSNVKRRLTKEENSLLMQLRSQDAEALKKIPGVSAMSRSELAEYGLPCNDPAEADACDALLQWQSESDIQDRKHKIKIAQVQKAAAEEFERMKLLQHRSAVAEVADVLQKNAMEERMRLKEEAHRTFLEEQNEARRRESLEAEREREKKRQTCIERFRETLRNRRRELELRAQYRDERSQLSQKRKDEELAQRKSRKEEEASKARKRLDSVNESTVEFRSILEDELHAKMTLHTSNTTQLQLRRRAAKDLKEAKEQIRFEMVDHVHDAVLSEQMQKEKDALQKEMDIARRKEAVKQAAFERSQMISEATEAAQKLSQDICRRDLLAREERRKQLEIEYETKDEQIRAVAEHRKVDRVIKSELTAQRLEHHEQNRKRVEKAIAFQQKLKAENVAREEERDRKQRDAEERHKKSMTDLATKLYKDREELAKKLDQSKSKIHQGSLVGLLDDCGSSTSSLQRQRSFGPTKEEIMRQAEAITSRYMAQGEAAGHSPSKPRPMSASISQQSDSTQPSSKPSQAQRRPLSAVGKRSPAPVDMSLQHELRNCGKLGPAFSPSPLVAKQLAEVDKLDAAQLQDEERRRCGVSRPPSGKQRSANSVHCSTTPLSELVQRMDALYHS